MEIIFAQTLNTIIVLLYDIHEINISQTKYLFAIKGAMLQQVLPEKPAPYYNKFHTGTVASSGVTFSTSRSGTFHWVFLQTSS
jgi:hypothetical protein